MTVWNTRGKRGDALEGLITLTNDYYKTHGYARVDKAATPVTVIELDGKGLISKAYFEKKATVDFYGIVQGHYIAFDAKETNMGSFPLKNLHAHQVDYMLDITKQGGLAFLIVHFKRHGTYYLLPFEIIHDYFMNTATGRKSIPYTDMIPDLEIKMTHNGILNYLPILNNYMTFKENMKINT